ncbi:DUF3050 domain-containing protein [Streptomyces sp. MMG1533]|uniref:DUF3050 domain-containing protein n=1 Tax=Streptomyces sp. MMG1533 TaxID=1415546 RepID=UPI002D21C707|nr:DUF3050 domain-containing protein [Streptomyces sp. MMG1533]
MSRYDWNMRHEGMDRARVDIEPARKQVSAHLLCRRISSRERMATFMTHRVFAVWDFMSLFESPQREPTCVDVPGVRRGSDRWSPTSAARTTSAEGGDRDGGPRVGGQGRSGAPGSGTGSRRLSTG